MIALTQEKREELIEYAKEVLVSHEQRGGDIDEKDIFKIALASLTAEKHRVGALDDRGDEYTLEFYPDPPVPEIKLPSRIENIHLRTPLEVEDMWIDRFKRLNGLGE